MQPWFTYPIVVPFGNPNYDVGLGGSHDMDVAPPPNAPVTALLPGTVSDISAPDWGKQVCLKLDSPYNGVPYMAYLHLSATNPALSVGNRVNVGDLVGWVGGANTQSQYAGTSNPTGQNFLNTPVMSSQIQCGVALMRGPAYGGAGWEVWPTNPNIDHSSSPLNPTQIILDAVKGYHMPIPIGWKDDGTTLIAPNGHKVVFGFRAHVINATPQWSANDQPLEEEHHVNVFEQSNPSWNKGGGQQQTFAQHMLAYTTTNGVQEEFMGAELMYYRKQASDLAAKAADLTAKLAACEAAVPPPPPPPVSEIPQAVLDDITSLASFITPASTVLNKLVSDAGLSVPPKV